MPETWNRAVDMEAQAPPCDKIPSAWSQRCPIAVLAGVATILSVYMGFYQWDLIGSAWSPVFDDGTETVLDSDESHKMYALLLCLVFADEWPPAPPV